MILAPLYPVLVPSVRFISLAILSFLGIYKLQPPHFDAILLQPVLNTDSNPQTYNFQASGSFANVPSRIKVELKLRSYKTSTAVQNHDYRDEGMVILVDEKSTQPLKPNHQYGVMRNGMNGNFFGGISAAKDATRTYEMRIIYKTTDDKVMAVHNFGTAVNPIEWKQP